MAVTKRKQIWFLDKLTEPDSEKGRLEKRFRILCAKRILEKRSRKRGNADDRIWNILCVYDSYVFFTCKVSRDGREEV